MQLKRDTDFALRLLLMLREKALTPENAIPIRELSAETGIPAVIVSRILGSLKEKGIVCAAETGKYRTGYYLNENAGQISLYELISVIEGRAELFAAFNKSDSAYSLCREKLMFTETEIKQCLSEVILEDLVEK